MNADTSLLPEVDAFADELAFRMFRPSLLDELLAAVTPELRTRDEAVEAARLRLTWLLYYVTGLELVSLRGQTRFTLDVLDRIRARLGAPARPDPRDPLDAAVHRFAQAVQSRGVHHRTIACAEAFAGIAGEPDNTGLKLALIRVVERIGAEFALAVEEIAATPDPRAGRPFIPAGVPEQEVAELKAELRQSGREWYRRLRQDLRHPASQMMLTNLPDGPSLWQHARLMGALGAGSLILAFGLLIAGIWAGALLAASAWYFVFERAKADAVYEVAARLLIFNRQNRRTVQVPLLEHR